MNVKEIIDIINEKCPAEWAESWDNVGLLVGNEKSTVRKVLLAVDPVTSVVNEALQNKAELIITHHPLMFSKINKITPNTYDGKIVLKLTENKINLCAMHTNVDFYTKGLNYIVAKALNLADKKVLVEHEKDKNVGIGIIGALPFAMAISLESLAEYVKKALKTDFVRIAGKPKTDIHKVAVVTGSGMDYVDDAIAQGADVLITGDVKYHDAINAVERGLCIIDAGHFETEKSVISFFENILADKLKKQNVEIIKSKQQCVFKTI